MRRTSHRAFTLVELLIVIFVLAILATLIFGVVGCGEQTPPASADRLQAKQTDVAMAEANRAVGMPNIANFQEKRWARTIFELRDRSDLVCHAYIITLTGEKVYLGKCIGYGLPYSVQYTNPERVVDYNDMVSTHRIGVEAGTLPQPDPNGLFMPDGLSATWLMMIHPETGELSPMYVENEIVVSPFPLH